MKMYLASMENQVPLLTKMGHVKYVLLSYFYLNKKSDNLEQILEKVDKVLIDSGAFSFQRGTKVDYDQYTFEYMQFIKKYANHPKIEGFFEMDIDKIVGYEKVLHYRKVLESVSDKIIPVWHSNRGVDEFIKMCKQYSGKRVAITGFINGDVVDSQYNLFLNTAHKYGCTMHILGMTRLDFMKELNLGENDSFDSNTWLRGGIFGTIFLPKNGTAIKRIYAYQGLREKYLDLAMHKFNLCTFAMVQENIDTIDQSVEIEKDVV